MLLKYVYLVLESRTYLEVYLMSNSPEQLAKAREKAAIANKGNKNGARKSRVLNDTLKRRLMQEDGEEANKVISALLTEAKEGNVAAIREVMDRAEGKVQNQTDIISSDGSLQSNLKIEFVDAADPKVSE